jgi:hypothetical protein
MMSSTHNNSANPPKSKSQIENVLHAANEAKIYTEKPGCAKGESWEVVDKQKVQDEQDKAEWVFVGKMVAEKKEKAKGRR